MNGILILNKENGITSAEELNKVKRILGIKGIGHTGTLDPMATGVLVVLLGKCTKLSDVITSLTKEYIATVKIGIKTDTLDITGNILEEKKEVLEKDKLLSVINSFKKTYEQEVPGYSSVRINGKHLYEYTREGIKVKLPKREVTIHEIELLEIKEDEFTFRCLVSKGTYIRSLIRDICDELGVIGTMSALNRTKQGIFGIKDSYTIEDIENGNYELIPLEKVLVHEKRIITEENKKQIMNGSILERKSDKEYFFYYENDILKVIYKIYDKNDKLIKPLLFL